MNYNVTPKTIGFDGVRLIQIKSQLGKYPEQAAALRANADKLLTVEPFTVVRKKLIPPSGNPNDYMTMGTYWWPDPDKPDGLPYIRKDGVHNPDAHPKCSSYQQMAEGAYKLAYAAYMFECDEYAKKAAELLCVWHVDKETRMNPHAEYAQAIPGVCDGRGIGIIDFGRSFAAMEACEILFAIGALSEFDYFAIKKWYVDFTNWLITSEKGIFEDNYFNNHGAWYDVQVLYAALFTGRKELARRVAMNTYRRRHKTHIMKDGTQPHELARTNAASYSMMNLEALVRLAVLSRKIGITEATEVDGEAGVCLIAEAARFLYPYAVYQENFPYQQIKPADFGGKMCRMLITLADLLGDGEYRAMAEKMAKPEYLLDVDIDL